TSDLSFSLGHRGNQNHPEVKEAVKKVVAAGRKHGKFLGRPAATAEQVREYRDLGFLLFQSKTDIGFLTAGARQFLGEVGRATEKPKTTPLY
ncbi:MAG: aldolase/citrate lyase family protein, partial [Bryobacteraceae bacterium]